MDAQAIIDSIKKAFCGLINFKIHEDNIEIITSTVTITDKFVSIFIIEREENFIITDGGWLDKNYYDTSFNIKIKSEDDKLIKNALLYSFDVLTTNESNNLYYFQRCDQIQNIASIVLNMASFVASAVNHSVINSLVNEEYKASQEFYSRVNNYLTNHFRNNISFENTTENLLNVKFDATITLDEKIIFIMFITGGNTLYLDENIKKALHRFQRVPKNIINGKKVERLVIVNDKNDVFNDYINNNSISTLLNRLTSDPILWSNRSSILKLFKY